MQILLMILIGLMPGDTLELTLTDAVDYALQHNPEIRQYELAYAKSLTQTGQARSAFYPSVTATGSYVYMTDVAVIQFDSIPIPMGQNENWNFKLSLQQVIFAWGKIYNAYRISDISQEIARLTLMRKQQEVRYSVTEGFYGLLVMDKMVQLSRESLDQLKRHESSVEKRYLAGLVPQFDLMRARVQVSNLNPQAIQAENGYKLMQEGFKMLLGLDLHTEVVLHGDLLLDKQAFDLEEMTVYAQEHRIELQNLKKTLKIVDLSRQIATRSNLPTLFAGATYDYSKPFGFGGNEWGSNIIFNLGFQWSLFNGFGNFYKHKEATLQIHEAELAYDNLKKAIELEVKQAYMNYEAAYEAVMTAQENVGQADEVFRLIDTRYRNGLATNLEFMDVQLASMQAQTNYLSALKEYYTAVAGIKKAIGKEE